MKTSKPQNKTARGKKLAEGVYTFLGYSICHGKDTADAFTKAKGWFWLDDTNRIRRAGSYKQAKSQVSSYVQYKADFSH